jgi:hypothetical protein
MLRYFEKQPYFIYGLFNDYVSSPDYMESNEKVIIEKLARKDV